jgi:DNA-binding helix-hairpin-helix protein with protein kinase domain
VQLSDKPLASGGEAAVYTVPQYPNVVVKLYNDRVLNERRTALTEKIEALCQPTFDAFKKHPALSWPRFSVFDDQGRWRGYAMRRVSGVSMKLLAHAMAYREHFPNLTRADIVSYLIALVKAVEFLHARGVLLGDYNLLNFLCDPNSHTVALIDCDSWQVTVNGRTYRNPVAVADLLAPELHGKRLAEVDRTLESEYFSLAILIFQALMLGRHPYDVIGSDGTPSENIRRGYFPYGIGGGGIPKGPWYNIWSHLPYSIKEQFCTTFKEGVKDPSKRTTTAQWKELLVRYRREIVVKKWHSNEIRPAEPDREGYRGTKSISQPVVSN